MERLDTLPLTMRSDEILAFSVVRNEILRLPFFLEYHRKHGINRFFFVDNNSTDGTRAFLLEQHDCHVYLEPSSFAASNYGNEWIKLLLDQYGEGHWCLIADADELLVYPHAKDTKIQALCSYMEHEGAQGLYTFMLDMYPEGELSKAIYKPGNSFFEIAPYFDKDYAFKNRIHLKKEKSFPPKEVLGGPRSRCFYHEEFDVSFARRFFVHLLSRGLLVLQKYLPLPRLNLKPPALFKVPLIKWKKGYEYYASTHVLTPVKLSEVTGVLAHFKYFSDFHERVLDAIKTGEHANGSAEYKRYWKYTQKGKTNAFHYEGTRKFKSDQTLTELGLILAPGEYEKFIAKQK